MDELVHQGKSLAQAVFVFTSRQICATNVVPGAHGLSAIQRHGAHRSARQQPTHGADGAEVDLVSHGQKIRAIGAQPMQHDDAGHSRCAGIEFDGLH